MSIARIVGLVILAAGIAILIFGINASHSTSEKVVEGVTGKYTDKTTWYIVGGIAGIVGGGALAAVGPKRGGA